MKWAGKWARLGTWIRHVLAGRTLHKALEKNEKAARELDAALREVLGK